MPNRTGFRGVYRTSWGNRYFASIYHAGRSTHLGTFNTAEEAAAAYDKAARSLHGDRAALNGVSAPGVRGVRLESPDDPADPHQDPQGDPDPGRDPVPEAEPGVGVSEQPLAVPEHERHQQD